MGVGDFELEKKTKKRILVLKQQSMVKRIYMYGRVYIRLKRNNREAINGLIGEKSLYFSEENCPFSLDYTTYI